MRAFYDAVFCLTLIRYRAASTYQPPTWLLLHQRRPTTDRLSYDDDDDDCVLLVQATVLYRSWCLLYCVMERRSIARVTCLRRCCIPSLVRRGATVELGQRWWPCAESCATQLFQESVLFFNYYCRSIHATTSTYYFLWSAWVDREWVNYAGRKAVDGGVTWSNKFGAGIWLS